MARVNIQYSEKNYLHYVLNTEPEGRRMKYWRENSKSLMAGPEKSSETFTAHGSTGQKTTGRVVRGQTSHCKKNSFFPPRRKPGGS